ncbi:MAG TPA: hypothetical protein PK537_00775 [Candidatus Limiplasma sp.]|nr:hypothetical protein [Candidatus Limiplasma sp.]
MPNRDGTGPLGNGAGRGNGRGNGRGGQGAGPTGSCVCPRCGARVPHTPGVPCTSMKCPKCGTQMIRDVS